MSQKDNKEMAKHFYRASAADFISLPGKVIAYWASRKTIELFSSQSFEKFASIRQGMATTDNERFLRKWYEISIHSIGFGYESPKAGNDDGYNWFPYNKGGEFRKWYGNQEYVVNYEKNGEVLIELVRGKYKKISDPEFVIKNRSYYCKEAITWSDVTSGVTSFRYIPQGMLFDGRGSCIFPYSEEPLGIIGFLNSPITIHSASLLNPTLVLNPGEIKKLPFNGKLCGERGLSISTALVTTSKIDWDAYETSWGFIKPLIFQYGSNVLELSGSYDLTRRSWDCSTQEMQRLEEENNRLFIEAYGLQDELTPDVPLSEITLTCNPHYRYGGNFSDEEREARLQSDTIAELVSYAIGCMMGRYSLDREGLVYAHAGNVGFNDLVAEGAYKTFAADGDGILPLTSEHVTVHPDQLTGKK